MRPPLLILACALVLGGCAPRQEDDLFHGDAGSPASVPERLEAVLAANSARAYWFTPQMETEADAPVVAMGGMNLGFLRRQEVRHPFVGEPVRRLLDQPPDAGINCLCGPDYGVGLAVYRDLRLRGWILLSENHNALLILDAEGAVLAQRRFQRDLAPPGSLFGKPVQTADLAALVRPYGIEFVGKGAEPAP